VKVEISIILKNRLNEIEIPSCSASPAMTTFALAPISVHLQIAVLHDRVVGDRLDHRDHRGGERDVVNERRGQRRDPEHLVDVGRRGGSALRLPTKYQ